MNNRRYLNITAQDMDAQLGSLGFKPVALPGVREAVYGRRQDVAGRCLCLRVFTGIVAGDSRKCGADAIRVALFEKLPSGQVVLVRGSTPIRRTPTWRTHLLVRLNDLSRTPPKLPACPVCGSAMSVRESKHGEFLGCTAYPRCRGTRPVEDAVESEPNDRVLAGV